MVVFGAGASYDSVPHRHPDSFTNLVHRPPLANELFADRPRFTEAMNRFPACEPIIPLLRHRNEGDSVEQVLERLQDQARGHSERVRQLAAIRFYLHFMLWDCKQQWDTEAKRITNYRTLLDLIELWRDKSESEDYISIDGYRSVCLVTFNYDTMLDDAFGASVRPITTLQDYIASPTYKLIKVHGSVNWAREVEAPVIADIGARGPWQIAHELIDRASDLKLRSVYRLVSEWPIGKSTDNRAIFPALAIPVQRKQDFECPKEHMDLLRASMPDVTKLLIIGWRGNEQHFVELLRNLRHPGVRGMIVAENQSVAAKIAVHLQHLRPAWNTGVGGFSHFITSGEADRFLGGGLS